MQSACPALSRACAERALPATGRCSGGIKSLSSLKVPSRDGASSEPPGNRGAGQRGSEQLASLSAMLWRRGALCKTGSARDTWCSSVMLTALFLLHHPRVSLGFGSMGAGGKGIDWGWSEAAIKKKAACAVLFATPSRPPPGGAGAGQPAGAVS